MLILTKFFAVVLIATLFAVASSLAASNFQAFPTEAYGYVPIGTNGAKMFYELQGDYDSTQAQRAKLPLATFMSGGPCSSSVGFPNFIERVGNRYIEIDPNNQSWIIKNSTNRWTRFANMVFFDSPMGTGWSQAVDIGDFCTTDFCIADNLVQAMKGFLKNHPEFEGSDFYIFGESYSGKAQAFFANALMKSGLNINVKATSNNDGWTDPISCMKSYGEFMRMNSLVNKVQSEELMDLALQAEAQLNAGNGTEATNLWSIQQSAYSTMAAGVNVYNIKYFYDYTADGVMNSFMNTYYRARVNAMVPGLISPNKQFNDQDGTCFNQMSNAFMTDGIAQMQELIDSGISVNVWSGAEDLIVDTLCTRMWIEKLPWSDLEAYQNAPRTSHALNPPQVNGFVQEYKNFRFWQTLRAGHLQPLDQGEWAAYMAEYIITNGQFEKAKKAIANGAAIKKNRLAQLKDKKHFRV